MGIDFNQVTFISYLVQLGVGTGVVYLFIPPTTRRRNSMFLSHLKCSVLPSSCGPDYRVYLLLCI